jgi:hypothetical protein
MEYWKWEILHLNIGVIVGKSKNKKSIIHDFTEKQHFQWMSLQKCIWLHGVIKLLPVISLFIKQEMSATLGTTRTYLLMQEFFSFLPILLHHHRHQWTASIRSPGSRIKYTRYIRPYKRREMLVVQDSSYSRRWKLQFLHKRKVNMYSSVSF